MFFSPNGKLQRKLARLFFEELGDAFHVFVLGQVCYPFHIAMKFGIKLVFYGENGEVEYGGDTRNMNNFAGDAIEDWAELYHKGVTFDNLAEKGLEKGILKEEDVKSNAFEF